MGFYSVRQADLKAEQNRALSFFLKAIQTNNGTKKELFSGKIHEIVAAD